MSTYSQDSNKSNRSIDAKSQQLPEKRDQRNTGTGSAGTKSTIIKPTQQPNQGGKINQNNKGNLPKEGENQWSPGRKA